MRRIEHIQKQEISERLFAERRRPRGCSSSSKAAKQQSSKAAAVGKEKEGGGRTRGEKTSRASFANQNATDGALGLDLARFGLRLHILCSSACTASKRHG